MIFGWLDFMDDTGSKNLHLSENLRTSMADKPGWLPGLNDIIPLTAPKFSQHTSLLCNIPMPNSYSPGLLRTQEGLHVFKRRLCTYSAQKESDASSQLMSVVDWMKRLEKIEVWMAKDSAWACVPTLEQTPPEHTIRQAFAYQYQVHRALDETEQALINMNVDPRGSCESDQKEKVKGLCYDTLLAEHIRMAILAHGKVMKIEQEYKGDTERHEAPHNPVYTQQPLNYEKGLKGRLWLEASMDTYWDELPSLAERVAKLTGCSRQVATDAWILMIFRSFCWHHCHRLLPQKMILPVEWHMSQMPVYLG